MRPAHIGQPHRAIILTALEVEQERVTNIAAAHQVGLSVRQIAAAVRLSPARVHQLLHAPGSAAVRATTMSWDGSPTLAWGPEAPAAVWSGPPSFVRSYKVWPSRVMTAAMWRART